MWGCWEGPAGGAGGAW